MTLRAGRRHILIPDTQVKPGVPIDNMGWIGEYIADHKPDVVIHLGDHADMPSLSSYDKGKKSFEGRKYIDDINSANTAFEILTRHIKSGFRRSPMPELYITLGNHEDRISRAIEDNAILDGLIGEGHLNYEALGWKAIPFKHVLTVDGVSYSHYFENPLTGKPYGGSALNRLKTVGHSFSMGHTQTFDFATRYLTNGTQQCALIAGAAYLHDESYRSPQANHHWRGIVVCNEVRMGGYDIMQVSLDYLCRRYEGITLNKFMKKISKKYK